MAPYLQYVDGVVKVVVLEGGGAVHGGKHRRVLHQVLVSEAAVIDVMTHARHKQRHRLQVSATRYQAVNATRCQAVSVTRCHSVNATRCQAVSCTKHKVNYSHGT